MNVRPLPPNDGAPFRCSEPVPVPKPVFWNECNKIAVCMTDDGPRCGDHTPVREHTVTISHSRILDSVDRRGYTNRWRCICNCGWKCEWQLTQGAAENIGRAHLRGVAKKEAASQ